MPHYLDPLGQRCSHKDAHSGTSMKRGYRSVVSDGERVGFEFAMLDSRHSGSTVFLQDAPAAPASIDEAVKLAIIQAAKNSGSTPTEWLAANAGKKLTDLIATTAERFVNAAGAGGIVKTFSIDGLALGAMRDLAMQANADQAARITDDLARIRAADAHNAWRTSRDGTSKIDPKAETGAAIKRQADDLHNGWRRQPASSN